MPDIGKRYWSVVAAVGAVVAVCAPELGDPLASLALELLLTALHDQSIRPLP